MMDDQELTNVTGAAERAAAHDHAAADIDNQLLQDLQLRVADLERRLQDYDEAFRKQD